MGSEMCIRDRLRRSNKNEQYSRKYNFKIMGLKETQKEKTREKVKTIINENAGAAIEDREIKRHIGSRENRGKADPFW